MSDTGDSYDSDAPVSVLGDAGTPQDLMGGDGSQPSILGGALNPQPWTPADSSLTMLMSPQDMQTIDFAGDDNADASGGDTVDDTGDDGADASGDGPAPSIIVPNVPDPGDVLTPDDIAGLEQTPALPPDDTDDASGDTPPAPKSPLTAWPVPGHTQLNPRDPSRQQGGGGFGAFRDHGGGAHTGIDITAPVGTPVVAAGDGTVASTQPGKFYGNQVVIQHAKGFGTQYGHMSRVDVKPGTVVHAGDQIGLSGRSGNVPKGADAHVHFEVRYGSLKPHVSGGQVVDPMQYLPATP